MEDSLDFEIWHEKMIFENLAVYEQACAFDDDEIISLPASQVRMFLKALSLILEDEDFSTKLYLDLEGDLHG